MTASTEKEKKKKKKEGKKTKGKKKPGFEAREVGGKVNEFAGGEGYI